MSFHFSLFTFHGSKLIDHVEFFRRKETSCIAPSNGGWIKLSVVNDQLRREVFLLEGIILYLFFRDEIEIV